MSASPVDLPTTPRAAPPSPALIPLLFLGYLLSYGDRFVFGLVLKPIEAYLHLNDSQAGLLAGLAFAATYALFSPLAGVLADRLPRKAIFLFAVAFWSCATFASGLAATLWQMGLARAAVGVGEALMIPLAISLIGDTVPVAGRARALSLFFAGGPVGSLSVLVVGGLLLKHLGGHALTLPILGTVQPWQSLFLSLALPGLLLCALVLLFMKEPVRQAASSSATRSNLRSGMPGALRFLRAHAKLTVALFLGYPLLVMASLAISNWAFIYFDRVYGIPADKAAVSFSLTAGVTTIAGCVFAGRLIALLRRRGYADASLRACLLGGCCFGSFAALALLMPGPRSVLACFAIAYFFAYVPVVGGYSAVSEMAPPGIRASIAGLNVLAVGLLTSSLGPWLVGVFSDHLFSGRLGIRWAMLATVAVSVIGGGTLILPAFEPFRLALASEQAAEAALAP